MATISLLHRRLPARVVRIDLILNYSATGLRFVESVVVARLLGSEGQGIYSAGRTAALLGSQVPAGTGIAAVSADAAAVGLAKPRSLSFVGYGVVGAGASTSVIGVGLGLAWFVDELRTANFVLIMAGVSALQAVGSVTRRLVAIERGATLAFANQATALVLQLLGVVVLWLAGYGSAVTFASTLVLMFGSAFLLDGLALSRVGRRAPIGPRALWGALNAGGLLHMLVNRADLLLVAYLLGAGQAGFYAVGLAAAQPVQQYGQVIAAREASQLSGLNRGDLVLPTLSMLAVSFLVAGSAYVLIPYVYGLEYQRSGPLAIVFCFAGLAQVAQHRLSFLALAKGRLRQVELSEWVGLVILIGGFAIGSAVLGIIGVAIASLLAYIARVLCLYWRINA